MVNVETACPQDDSDAAPLQGPVGNCEALASEVGIWQPELREAGLAQLLKAFPSTFQPLLVCAAFGTVHKLAFACASWHR